MILDKGSKDIGKMNVKEEDEALFQVIEGSSQFRVYDFLQVLEATNNFSQENKLGQGGFGPVYKVRDRIKHLVLRTQKETQNKPSRGLVIGHVWDEREAFSNTFSYKPAKFMIPNSPLNHVQVTVLFSLPS
jgi:hypothetical protein